MLASLNAGCNFEGVWQVLVICSGMSLVYAVAGSQIDSCAIPISSAWRTRIIRLIQCPNLDKIWGVWMYGHPKSGGILGILDVTSFPFLERSWGVWMGPI